MTGRSAGRPPAPACLLPSLQGTRDWRGARGATGQTGEGEVGLETACPGAAPSAGPHFAAPRCPAQERRGEGSPALPAGVKDWQGKAWEPAWPLWPWLCCRQLSGIPEALAGPPPSGHSLCSRLCTDNKVITVAVMPSLACWLPFMGHQRVWLCPPAAPSLPHLTLSPPSWEPSRCPLPSPCPGPFFCDSPCVLFVRPWSHVHCLRRVGLCLTHLLVSCTSQHGPCLLGCSVSTE